MSNLALRWISYIGLCGSVALLGISFWYEITLSSELLPQVAQNKELQAQSLKGYQTDLAWIGDHPIFSKNKQVANFQEFLFQLKTRYSENAFEDHPVLHPLFLNQEVKTKVLELGNDWVEKYFKLRSFEIDLSFFENILGYDYWNINSPQITWSQKLDPFNLVLSLKIYVLKSIRDQAPQDEILIKIRKMANLLASVEDMDFKMTALSILKIEHDTFTYFNKRSPSMNLKSWKIIEVEELNRIRRTLLATSGYLEPWTAPEILQEVFLSSEPPLGFCAAYKSKRKKIEGLKHMFEKKFIFEVSFHQSQETLKKITEKFKEKCTDMPELEKIQAYQMENIPFLRRITGIKIAMKDVYPYHEYQ